MNSGELSQDIKDNIIQKTIKGQLLLNDLENDKLILILIFFHWLVASTLMAVSYNTYLFGFLNGAILSLLSYVVYRYYKGTIFSRVVFGSVLLAFSTIFIQQHMGRIEMHFHIFVAIAFLTIYKDYFAVLGGSVVILVHHVIGNILQTNGVLLFDMPVYVFNYGCGFDIVLLHATFVILEFIVVAYFNSVSRKRSIAILTSEFKFKELSASLEKVVDSRTAQYQSAKEDAEAANRAKTTFLANMSHEIRTPLNAILGFVQILQENETDKEKSKYIYTIKKSSDSLLDIINDILDFVKVESGKMIVDPISVNPHEDFDNIGSLFFAKSEDIGLQFQLYIDPNLPQRIVIDSLRIRQILTNLLSNAMKFSLKDGIVLLEIKYNQDDTTISFSIKDNGIGIAKENHSKIFDAFSQEENSTSRKYGGTGLGLAISSKLVALMDSKLELKSESGEGSEFFFTIKIELPEEEESFSPIPNISKINVVMLCPKEKKEYEDVLQEYLESFGIDNISHPNTLDEVTPNPHQLLIINASAYDTETIQSFLDKGHTIIVIKTSLSQNFSDVFSGKIAIIDPPFTPSSVHDALLELFLNRVEDDTKIEIAHEFNKNANILIVEDNESNQYLMSVIMKKLGLKYSFANDGLEAIVMFKDNKYDLILMDENMPNMNGIEATQNILKIEKESNLVHTPIISLTANAIKGDREKFLEAGMDEYLSKPISIDDLTLMLKHFLPVEDKDYETTQEVLAEEKEVIIIEEAFEILTIASLADKKGFDEEDIEALLGMFLSHIDKEVATLNDAVRKEDYDTIFRTSHSIKGSSGNIGLEDIFKLAGLIEHKARAKEAYEYETQVKKLENLVDVVKKIKVT